MQNFIIFASRYAEEFGFTAYDDLMGELGKIPVGPRHFMDAMTRQDDFPVSVRYAIGCAISSAERERLSKGAVEWSGESRYVSIETRMTDIFERWRTPAAAENGKVRQLEQMNLPLVKRGRFCSFSQHDRDVPNQVKGRRTAQRENLMNEVTRKVEATTETVQRPQILKEIALRLREQMVREEQERIRQEALREAAKRSFAAD